MNKAFMPGIVPEEMHPDMEKLLRLDRDFVTSQMVLGNITDDIGDAVVSYINKYIHYAQS